MIAPVVKQKVAGVSRELVGARIEKEEKNEKAEQSLEKEEELRVDTTNDLSKL